MTTRHGPSDRTSEPIRSVARAPTPYGLTDAEFADLLCVLDDARANAAAIIVRAERDGPANDDAATEALHRAQIRLAVIHSAYERMTDGSYNICSSCGGHIGAPRLRALPESDRCVACAATGRVGT